MSISERQEINLAAVLSGKARCGLALARYGRVLRRVRRYYLCVFLS